VEHVKYFLYVRGYCIFLLFCGVSLLFITNYKGYDFDSIFENKKLTIVILQGLGIILVVFGSSVIYYLYKIKTILEKQIEVNKTQNLLFK